MRFYLLTVIIISLLCVDKYLSDTTPPKVNQSTVDKPLHSLKLMKCNKERVEDMKPTIFATTKRKELSNWNNIEVISPLLNN